MDYAAFSELKSLLLYCQVQFFKIPEHWVHAEKHVEYFCYTNRFG